MEPQEELNADLERRLRALEVPPHSTSECMGSSKSVLIEALVWAAGASIIWILSILFL